MYAVYMCGTTSIIVHLHVYVPTLLHDHGTVAGADLGFSEGGG